MTNSSIPPWEETRRVLPYRDYRGNWVFLPHYTQRRQIKGTWQYREREETDEEAMHRQL